MKLHKCSEIGLFVALLAVPVLFVGCIVSKTDEQYTGIENETLKQVERGQTTRDWVIETFGEPSEQILTDDGSERRHRPAVLEREVVKRNAPNDTLRSIVSTPQSGLLP